MAPSTYSSAEICPYSSSKWTGAPTVNWCRRANTRAESFPVALTRTLQRWASLASRGELMGRRRYQSCRGTLSGVPRDEWDTENPLGAGLVLRIMRDDEPRRRLAGDPR